MPLKLLLLPFLFALFFTGCATSMSSVSAKPMTEVTKDPTKAYIVFSRPEMVGMALSNTIIEFDPATRETKPLGTLAYETKIVYATTPGTHYFYMDGGENDDMIKMTVAAGRVYYVHTPPSMGVVAGRFYFKPLRYTEYTTIRSLKGQTCDEALLKKYGFEAVENEASSFAASDQFHSDRLKTTIDCSRGKVVRVHSAYDLEELKSAKLIVPNEKALAYYREHLPGYLKEIAEDHPEWIRKEAAETEVKPEDGFPLTI
ncbi:hypothetical protein [Hydrogenimonas sp.]